MNRRNFLSLLGLGVAGIAVEQAIPLGRVWSFPKEIVIAPAVRLIAGADFGFDPINNVTMIEQWFVDRGRRIVLQRSMLMSDGSCRVLDVKETPYRDMPFTRSMMLTDAT